MISSKINTNNLIVYYIVAREKSVTGAAEFLCLTQPTITRHIKDLETATGIKLFDINKHKVRLTSNGELLLPYAKEIYQQSRYAERMIQVIKNRNLSIGIPSFLNSTFAIIINNIHRYMTSSSNITVFRKESHELISDVLDAEIDLAIVPIYEFERVNPRLNYVTVANNIKTTFFTSHNHPLWKNKNPNIEDVSNYTFILPMEGTPARVFINKQLEMEGLNPKVISTLKIHAPEILKYIVMESQYIGYAAFRDIEEEVKEDKLRIIPMHNDIYLQLAVFAYRESFNAPYINEIISLIKNLIAAINN